MSTPPLPGFQALALILSVMAMITAWALAHRRREHRPVALALALLVGADVARAILHAVLPSLAGPVPYAGMTRAAFHIEQGLYLLWPLALARLSLLLFAGRREGICGDALVWGSVWLSLIVGYPEVHGEQLRQVYLAAMLASLCVSTGAILSRMMGHRGTDGLPSPGAVVVAALVAVELVALVAGPWTRGLFGAAYELEQVALVVGYSFVVVVQGGALWAERS